jgi:hypothetical protein
MNGLAQHKVLFNNNSYLSVGNVVLVICATIWLSNGLGKVETSAKDATTYASEVKVELGHYKEIQTLRDDVINAKIDSLLGLVKLSTDDKYTGHDHKMFSERLQELNPNLKVPKAP